jgi:hypothetical protein
VRGLSGVDEVHIGYKVILQIAHEDVIMGLVPEQRDMSANCTRLGQASGSRHGGVVC